MGRALHKKVHPTGATPRTPGGAKPVRFCGDCGRDQGKDPGRFCEECCANGEEQGTGGLQTKHGVCFRVSVMVTVRVWVRVCLTK